MATLFPRLSDGDDGEAIRVAGVSLSYRALRGAAAVVAGRLAGMERVAVRAQPVAETCVAVVGALAAGVAVVPLSPDAGARELEHVLADSAPSLVLEPADVDLRARAADLPDELGSEETAIVLYTSGTTGPPKGVEIPRRAIESNLDALAEVWGWSDDDRLVHALPLFHVHGLVLGILGPLRRGGSVEHAGRFAPAALADGLRRGGTMVFGVPTMYRRVGLEAEADPELAAAFAGARLLVSGSAGLPAVEHRRIERLTGQRIAERYGMTETLMNAAARADGPRAPGSVGPPLPGVELRLVDDDGAPLEPPGGETIGEIQVRGPNLFRGYLNRPEATEAAFAENGWFCTGDLATCAPGGGLRIVGRRATDLIMSGGYKIGAGEVEAALLEHPAVAECAVAGRPDDDLGEHVAAWVVPAPGAAVTADELAAHVAGLIAAHKRPREVRFVEELPRNAMGKVRKAALAGVPECGGDPGDRA